MLDAEGIFLLHRLYFIRGGEPLLMRIKTITVFLLCLFAIACASKKAPESILTANDSSSIQQPQINTKETPSPTTQTEPPLVQTDETQSIGSDDNEELVQEDLDYFDHEKELERSLGKEKKEEAPSFDIPMVMNERVEWWVKNFQNEGQKFFRVWLERSEKYIPMMKKILRENGLPEDLIYLAMIESGFKPFAYSRAKAAGPWQFIVRTGRRYGLRTDWCIDERRDPEKSTIAAAQHLKDLYDEFDHWYLAAAGYNAGAGKIKRAIEKYSTEDFWEMSKFRYLKRETKDYVPKMIAAALIAKNPAQYGFTDIAYEDPLEYDKVVVSKPTDLKSIAEATQTTVETLKSLNPELTRWFTPPDYPNYELKIPKGTSDKFAANQSTLKTVMVSSTVQHRLRKGETLSHVAKSYGTSIDSILVFNSIASPKRIRTGQIIYVPVRAGTKPKLYAQASAPIVPTKIDTDSYKKEIKADGAVGYSVKIGDTIWSISRAFNVTVKEIRKWNKLGSVRMIHPGDRLVIYPKFLNTGNGDNPKNLPAQSTPTSRNTKYYKVKTGDTIWAISKSHNVPVNKLISLNNLGEKGIRPGDLIKLVY